jgi:plastocyanin
MIARRFPWLALVGASVLLTGCLTAAQSGQSDLGSNSNPDGDDGPPDKPVTTDLSNTVKVDAFMSTGTTSIKLSADTATFRLNETQTFTITVSTTGAGGTATLALADSPTGLTATFNPATVVVSSTPVTATMTVTAASNMDSAASVATSVQATINGEISSTTFGLTVLPELLISIAEGVATTNNGTAFGAAVIPVKAVAAGVKVVFQNNDIINHEIHADGTGGIPHEGGPLDANGGVYDTNPGSNPAVPLTITPGFTGPINFRCHIHGGMTGQIMVQ